jgi:hypothetical protein
MHVVVAEFLLGKPSVHVVVYIYEEARKALSTLKNLVIGSDVRDECAVMLPAGGARNERLQGLHEPIRMKHLRARRIGYWISESARMDELPSCCSPNFAIHATTESITKVFILALKRATSPF